MDDLTDQSDWWEDQEFGLGAEFEAEFWNALTQIQSRPETYRPVYNNFRRMLTERFHSHIYFQCDEDGIVVTLLRDARRDDKRIPSILKARI
jgi:hypothetical protein